MEPKFVMVNLVSVNLVQFYDFGLFYLDLLTRDL